MTRRRSGIRGPLSDEDVRLWEMMKQRLEPLRNAKRRVTSTETSIPTEAEARERPGPPPAAKGAAPAKTSKPQLSVRLGAVPVPAAPVESKTSFKPAAPPSSQGLEKRTARKLTKGQRPIDAVLDLHGMRQHEAHLVLRRFIAQSHASGHKFVKVITGKGGRLGGDDGERQRPFDAPAKGERGVLKRLVPEWLRESDMAALVVAFSSAGRGHGGEGALYVELRRRRPWR